MTKHGTTIVMALASAALVSACNHRTGDLASYTRAHCSIVADDLREMAEHYRTRSSLAEKNLSKDQLDAADLTLGNLGQEARGVMSLALQRDFGFCVMIRADRLRANKLEEEFQRDLKTYYESPDLTVRSKSIDGMAAKAHELAQLELDGQPAAP